MDGNIILVIGTIGIGIMTICMIPVLVHTLFHLDEIPTKTKCMTMDDDYLYEVESAYYNLISDVQDLFVSEYLNETERVQIVRAQLKKRVMAYKNAGYHFMRSKRMNGTIKLD